MLRMNPVNLPWEDAFDALTKTANLRASVDDLAQRILDRVGLQHRIDRAIEGINLIDDRSNELRQHDRGWRVVDRLDAKRLTRDLDAAPTIDRAQVAIALEHLFAEISPAIHDTEVGIAENAVDGDRAKASANVRGVTGVLRSGLIGDTPEQRLVALRNLLDQIGRLSVRRLLSNADTFDHRRGACEPLTGSRCGGKSHVPKPRASHMRTFQITSDPRRVRSRENASSREWRTGIFGFGDADRKS